MPGMPGGPKPGVPFRPRAPEPEEEEHGEHHCAGHGPEDPPPEINIWHGMLMVDNERALQPGFFNQLLFRYENPKDRCDPRNQPPPYLASLLNFAILAFVLARFGRKPLADALLQRKQSIMAEIDTATRLKEDAQARLEEYEDRLENIGEKLDEVRAEYAAQAEIEKQHILAEAEERRARMRRDAEFRIEQERKAARDELLHEAVANATAAAEALIKTQMSAGDQDKMAAAYLQAIGAAVAKSSTRPGVEAR
jgi:F-type H+-transporting ATPase subunit b